MLLEAAGTILLCMKALKKPVSYMLTVIYLTHTCPLKGVRVVLSTDAPSRAPGKRGNSGLIETQTRGQNVLKWTAMEEG
jgi:hypothetical protein